MSGPRPRHAPRPSRALCRRRAPDPGPARAPLGLTLVELVTVIAVIAIVASIGARFMVRPVQASLAGAGAMGLADQASQATRLLAEDLRGALPNSVRIAAGPGGTRWLELIPSRGVGRYRIRSAATGSPGDPLDLEDPADASFDALGFVPALPAGAQLVIHNLGTADGDAYAGNNRRGGVSLVGASLRFTPAGAFPNGSPSGRFALVTTAVSWVCAPAADGSGTLARIDGYAIQAAQPVDTAAAPLAGANAVVVARGVTDCAFTQDVAQANLGLVGARIALSADGATAQLARQFVVDATP